MRFRVASSEAWQLERTIGSARKKRLLGASFDVIVKQTKKIVDMEEFG